LGMRITKQHWKFHYPVAVGVGVSGAGMAAGVAV